MHQHGTPPTHPPTHKHTYTAPPLSAPIGREALGGEGASGCTSPLHTLPPVDAEVTRCYVQPRHLHATPSALCALVPSPADGASHDPGTTALPHTPHIPRPHSTKHNTTQRLPHGNSAFNRPSLTPSPRSPAESRAAQGAVKSKDYNPFQGTRPGGAAFGPRSLYAAGPHAVLQWSFESVVGKIYRPGHLLRNT